MNGFKQFIMRGNVVDLAVGVVIGAAFGAVVTSLVEKVITPLISAITRLPDFSRMALTINGTSIGYGSFLNALITFLIISAAIYYIVVLPMGKLMARVTKFQNPTTKSCDECCSEVPIAARRCKHCGQPVV
jgi:large conductance mechanosensitive channel